MNKVLIKEIGKVITGNTPSKSNLEYYDSNDIFFVKPDIINDLEVTNIEYTKEYISEKARNKARIVKKNTVFVTCIGTIGKIGIASGDEFAFNQQINAIEPNDRVLPRYLAYNLLFNKKRLINIANAPVVPIINKTQFENFSIDIDENLDKQKDIINVLDRIKNLIYLRKKQLDELENLIKSQFIEMFGDPIINSKEWSKYKLDEICVINPKKSELNYIDNNFKVSFVTMASVSEKGNIDVSDVRTYEEVRNGFTYFKEGDVLFAKITPCMENGKGAIAKGLKNEIGFGSTEFHVLRPKCQYINSQWIYTLTSFKSFRIEAEKRMTGSAGQKRVPVSFLECLEIGVPPVELQDQFANLVKKIDKQKIVIQQNVIQLQGLFNSLTQKFFCREL